MKREGYKVESVTEYAKDLTYGEDFVRLSDQLHILGEQHHRMYRLRNQVDYIVHDSPFIMGMTYLQDDPHIPKKLYKKLMVEMFKSYNNINILLTRNKKYEYQEHGRNQTEVESDKKAKEIKKMLDKYNIPYIEMKSNSKTVKNILSLL